MGIAGDLLVIFNCVPVNGSWDPAVRVVAHCVDLRAAIGAWGNQNAVVDIVILFLPLPIVWGMRLNRGEKARMGGVLLVGCL